MKHLALVSLAAALTLGGCSGSTGPDGGQPRVSLSFTAAGPAGPNFSFASARPEEFSDGTNTLSITSAEVVLREIELKRIDVASCTDDDGPDDDGCEEFALGPVLVNLPLDGNPAQSLTIDIEPGTYREIEFDIHKVGDDTPEELAFLEAHQDLEGISIRVRGTYNDEAFSYTTDLNEEQEIELEDLLVIDELTTTTDVTVSLDISQWFVTPTGALVDPSTGNKGEVNEGMVKENIKNSIEAFEERN